MNVNYDKWDNTTGSHPQQPEEKNVCGYGACGWESVFCAGNAHMQDAFSLA